MRYVVFASKYVLIRTEDKLRLALHHGNCALMHQPSETKMLNFMEGADKRYIIPVYQRKYNWKQENCQQLYDDLKKIIRDKRESQVA